MRKKMQMNTERISKLFGTAQDEIEVDKELQSLLPLKRSTTPLKTFLKGGTNIDVILSQFEVCISNNFLEEIFNTSVELFIIEKFNQ
jgi:hypothetical protein